MSHPTIADLLATAEHPLASFEFFPPKSEEESERLWQTIHRLAPLKPDFVSVTYGANGSNRDRTIHLTRRLALDPHVRTMGHLTCASQSRDSLIETIESYRDAGLRHILAVRGDMPGGPTEPWVRHPQGLSNATELVRLVNEVGDFCVGVAAFPDVHPQARDADLDARLLVEKAEAGASFAITQLFFDADAYFRLVDRVRALGCDLPIIPGIQPITLYSQVRRFAEFSGAELPTAVVSRLDAVADDPDAVREVGRQIGVELCRRLLDGGAPGLHFFTLNKSAATRSIVSELWRLQR